MVELFNWVRHFPVKRRQEGWWIVQSRQSRVLSFFPVVGIGTPQLLPHPTPFGTVGGHTGLRERGWGSPNADDGTNTVELYINISLVVVAVGRVDYNVFHDPTIRIMVTLAQPWIPSI
jgi:hypothetical protein